MRTDQLNRLQAEDAILRRFFPQLQWAEASGELRVEGWLRTNPGRWYYVRLFVPRDFPNSVPTVIVVSPLPLRDHRGDDLCSYGADRAMHLLHPVQGCISICHYSPHRWTPAVTLYKVFVKARLWLEAYEAHCVSGKPIDSYLGHQ